MELFWRLYLGHLLADFPFQTNAIFAWKMRSFAGVLVHAAVVVLASALMMGPLALQPENWVLLSFLGVLHAVQDHLKVLYGRWSGHDGLLPYVLDQLGHLACTGLGVWLFQPWTLTFVPWPAGWGLWSLLFNDLRVVVVACALVALTFGVDVARHLRQGDRGPLVRGWYGMAERAWLLVAGAVSLMSPWAWLLVGLWAIVRIGSRGSLGRQGLVPALAALAVGLLVIQYTGATTGSIGAAEPMPLSVAPAPPIEP